MQVRTPHAAFFYSQPKFSHRCPWDDTQSVLITGNIVEKLKTISDLVSKIEVSAQTFFVQKSVVNKLCNEIGEPEVDEPEGGDITPRDAISKISENLSTVTRLLNRATELEISDRANELANSGGMEMRNEIRETANLKRRLWAEDDEDVAEEKEDNKDVVEVD